MNVSSAPAWSFPGRSEEKSTFTTPGPGNYNPKLQTFSNTPNVKIGTSSRSNIFASTTPGPGAYNTSGSLTNRPAPKIGSSKRPPLSDSLLTPGPGTYEIKSTAVEGPKFSMPGRSSSKKLDNMPGPGHYDHSQTEQNVRERAPAYKIGTEARTERPQSAYVPGPGTYSVDKKDLGPKWGFGSQSRDNIFKIEVPGPGTYNMPSSQSNRGFSMTGRKPDSPKDQNPGPGAYNPAPVRPKSPNWTLGKSPKGESRNNSMAPGPGAYNIKSELNSSAPVFGTSTRGPLNGSINTPGPGQYNENFKNTGPAYSMRPKTATKNASSVPGPGQYNPSASCGNFSWTIGKEAKGLNLAQEKKRAAPGPGQYNVTKGLGGPKWGFGSSGRNNAKKDFTPGPGAYSSYSTIGNLPSYAKTSR